MLDPWIIEEIRRRKERQRAALLELELPIAPPVDEDGKKKKDDEGEDRGVTVIDFSV